MKSGVKIFDYTQQVNLCTLSIRVYNISDRILVCYNLKAMYKSLLKYSLQVRTPLSDEDYSVLVRNNALIYNFPVTHLKGILIPTYPIFFKFVNKFKLSLLF